MFDPSIGRWFEEDPIGFAAGDANLYRYVGNSPTNETDPSGLADAKEFETANPLSSTGKTVDLSRLANACGAKLAATKEKTGNPLPRHVLTQRAGLVDMKHFFQLFYLTASIGGDAALSMGIRNELRDNQNSSFMPDDILSNALGVKFADSCGLNALTPIDAATLNREFSRFLQALKPIAWSALSNEDKAIGIAYYSSDIDGQKNQRRSIDTAINAKRIQKLDAFKDKPKVKFDFELTQVAVPTPAAIPIVGRFFKAVPPLQIPVPAYRELRWQNVRIK